jgi:enamine deaminase RidA (YjgF/YER057c/UK114 family)
MLREEDMDFEILNPDGVHETTNYSHAAKMGGLLFVSGQVAKDSSGQIVGRGDARRQTEQVLENLKTVLEAAGSGIDMIGKLTVYTTNLGFRPAIVEARNSVFGPIGRFPASTFVVVSSLADPDFLVEIEAVAALR